MYTYDVISESVRNPHQLAAELTRRSQEGWEVVQIAYDGAAWFHAFIRHSGYVSVAPHPGMTPDQLKANDAAPAAAANAVTGATPVASTTATGATPNVPADWYKDPSGRFELRYWNGTAWTEHVATGGTQSTDAPR
jgi:hypothetical protein